MLSTKPLYREDGWVLGSCASCGKLNYVEPHGTTAACKCPGGHLRMREHVSVPYIYRTGLMQDRVLCVNGRLPRQSA
jgi:hypothetical protein